VRQGHGHIVNIASLAALAPIPGLALYSASKYAVRAFSLAAAEDLRPHGVAVTTVCPDAVKTPMFDHQMDYPEAALTFTAPKVLAVEEVSRVILGRVLERRPLLVVIPRWRGWLARLADVLPSASRVLASVLTRQGLRRQAEWRKR
jgi:3-oxoacyl-[acyl-carrier protein] reductase